MKKRKNIAEQLWNHWMKNGGKNDLNKMYSEVIAESIIEEIAEERKE